VDGRVNCELFMRALMGARHSAPGRWADDQSQQDPIIIGKTAWHLALTLAVLSTIGCDRVTKHAAATFLPGLPSRSYLADTVRLEYVENTGGFLSLGAELPSAVRTGLFTVGTGLLLCMLVGITRDG
jgi:lipoprotein signal peptidase